MAKLSLLLYLVAVATAALVLPPTPQYTPWNPCPLQGCNATTNDSLGYCSQYSGASCCNAQEALAVERYVQDVLFVRYSNGTCRAALEQYMCGVYCSPDQRDWTVREESSLSLQVRVQSAYCSELATACGETSCNVFLPDSLGPWPLETVVLASSGVTRALLEAVPPTVPLGSGVVEEVNVVAAGPQNTGLLTGGLVGSGYGWTLIAGNRYGAVSEGPVETVALPAPPGWSGSEAQSAAPPAALYNGTFGVSVAGRYEPLTLSLASEPVANVPFSLTWLDPTACLRRDNQTGPTFASDPPGSLAQCNAYARNACCDAALVATLDTHWARLEAQFGPWPPSECRRQLDILACGMACSPRNLAWLDRGGGGNCTTNATACDATVAVCPDFCDDVWSACRDVVPNGQTATVAELYPGGAPQFCVAQFPTTYLGQPVDLLLVNDTTPVEECFFGLLREPACGNTSYVRDRAPLIAGVEGGFVLVAQDCFGNPRISGGDAFQVVARDRVTGAAVAASLIDNQDGTYQVRLTAFRACLDACVEVNITLNGERVQNVPTRLNVVPDCPHGPSTLVMPPLTASDQLPLRLMFTAYDAYLNVAYNAPESAFQLSVSDALDGSVLGVYPAASLDCNGTFVADLPALNTSCARVCLNVACARDGSVTNAFCQLLCNQTSFIYFTNTGTRITFDLGCQAPPFVASLVGEFDCCQVVRNCELLGPIGEARCVMTNSTHMQAFLPYNATVCSADSPDCMGGLDQLLLDCSVLQLETCLTGACVTPLVTTRLEPELPDGPIVRVTGPQAVVRCAGLTLSTSGSTQAGGRPWASVQWTVEPPFTPGDNHEALMAWLQGQTDSSGELVVSADDARSLLVAGVRYTFQVVLTNHLGYAGRATIQVLILADTDNGPSTLVISPAAPRAPARRQPLGYHVFVTRSGCLTGDGDLTYVEGAVAWMMPLEPSQPLYEWSANRTINQNSLELPPPLSLPQLGSASIFQALALPLYPEEEAPVNQSTALRSVTPQVRAPYVYVSGGSTRLKVLGRSNLVLNASVVFDWNVAIDNSSVAFAWTCETLDGGACFEPSQAALLLRPEPVISLPPTSLTLDLYEFTCTTTSMGASTIITIRVQTNGTAPDVLVNRSGARVRGGTAPGQLQGLNGATEEDGRFDPMLPTWSAPSGNMPAPTALPGLPSQAWLGGSSVGSDGQYRVRLTVDDSEGRGFAELAWTANDRPNGGFCVLGAAALSERGPPPGLRGVSLQCSNWEDRQSDPLSYLIEQQLGDDTLFLPVAYGRWWSNVVVGEVVSAARVQLRVTVVDATGQGRSSYLLPPLESTSGSAAVRACQADRALALAQQTAADAVALDSSRILQRVVAVAHMLHATMGCEEQVATAARSSALALLSCNLRSAPMRIRTIQLARTLALLSSAAGWRDLSLRRVLLLLRDSSSAVLGATFEQEGVRVASVVTALLGAAEAVVGSEPEERLSLETLTELQQMMQAWGAALAADLRPGEPPARCSGPRGQLQVAAMWWVPLNTPPPLLYYRGALLASSPVWQPNEPAASGGFLSAMLPPVTKPLTLERVVLLSQALRGVAVPGAPLAQLEVNSGAELPEVPSSVVLLWPVAVGAVAEPLVCRVRFSKSEEWQVGNCGDVTRLNASHVTCQCSAAPATALFPLLSLPDGPLAAPLLPGPAARREVPLNPALTVGLVIAAFALLALLVLLAVLYARPAASPALLVSSGAGAARVPADNHLPGALGAPRAAARDPAGSSGGSSEAAVDGGAVFGGQRAPATPPSSSTSDIWVSDDDNDAERLLHSSDVMNSEDIGHVYRAKHDFW